LGWLLRGKVLNVIYIVLCNLMTEIREHKPVIKAKDISAEMETEILAIAKYALDKMHTIQ
jgi:hypothetical protein